MSNAFEKFFKEEKIAQAELDKAISNPPEEKRVTGKIIKVQMGKEGEEESKSGGWGFISSKAIPFTRIFFHWTSLKQDTLKFQQLKNGMKVEFTAVEVEGKGWRAIKIKVVNGEQTTTT